MESLREAFEAFADEQRVERLRNCQRIQERVNQCLAVKTAVEAEKVKPFEEGESGHGNRALSKGSTSLMPWRRKEIAVEDGEREIKKEVVESIQPRISDDSTDRRVIRLGESAAFLDCDAITQDDVWKCRATALNCGHELSSLKDCLIKESEGYEMNSASTQGCKAEKDTLGQCMSKNAFALENRLRRRKEAAREEKKK
jgi:hypothetical protein